MYLKVLVFLLLLSCSVLSEEKYKEVSYNETIESHATTFNIDLGNQPVGVPILLTLNIKNNTDGDLDLNIVTGCSCTKVSDGNIKSKNGETMKIVVKFTTKQNADINFAEVKFFDDNREFAFDVKAKYISVIPVSVEKSLYTLKSQTKESITVNVETLFPFIKLKNISIESDRVADVSSDTNFVKFTILPNIDKIPSEILYIKISYFNEELETESIFDLPIKIEYSGVISITPSKIRMHNLDGSWRGFFLVSGIFDSEHYNDVKIWIQGKEKITCDIEKSENKNDRVRTFKIITKSELSDSEEYILVVDYGMGISATAKIQVQ